MTPGLFATKNAIQAQLNRLSARALQLSRRREIEAQNVAKLKTRARNLQESDIAAAKLFSNDLFFDEHGEPVFQPETIQVMEELKTAEKLLEETEKEIEEVELECKALMRK